METTPTQNGTNPSISLEITPPNIWEEPLYFDGKYPLAFWNAPLQTSSSNAPNFP